MHGNGFDHWGLAMATPWAHWLGKTDLMRKLVVLQDLAPSPAAPINEPRQPSPKAAAPKQEASKEAGKAPAFSFSAARQPVEAAKESAKEAAKSIPEPEPKKSPEPVPSFNFSSKPQVHMPPRPPPILQPF